MSHDAAAIEHFEFTSKKRRLRRRVLIFSLLVAVAAELLAAVVFFIIEVYLPLGRLEETNQKTFERISCGLQACDISALSNDFDFTGSNYVLDKETYFFLSSEPPQDFLRFALHFSDHNFMMQFQSPGTAITPAGESWRLYSVEGQFGEKRLAIMVGYALKVSWKMEVSTPMIDLIDQELRRQGEILTETLRQKNGDVNLSSTVTKKISADAYEIVDLKNDEILAGGYWLPVYFPRSKSLPPAGASLHRNKDELYLAKTDVKGRLLLASTQLIGDLRSLVGLFVLVFLISHSISYYAGITWLRRHFLISDVQLPTLEQALEIGEGKQVEFKRSFSTQSAHSLEQSLQTVAAFANTGDGVLFIGVEDGGQIKGISADSSKQKDQYSQRVYQAVRQRIKPSPSVQVDFCVIRDFVVCKITVPRGEEPLHFLDGVVYVRYGSSDIKAQPEMVKKILKEYKF